MTDEVDKWRSSCEFQYREMYELVGDADEIAKLDERYVVRLATLEGFREPERSWTDRAWQSAVTWAAVIAVLGVILPAPFLLLGGLLDSDQSHENYLGADLDLALYWGIVVGAAAVGVLYYSQYLERKEKDRKARLSEAREAYGRVLEKRIDKGKSGDFEAFLFDCWPFLGSFTVDR